MTLKSKAIVLCVLGIVDSIAAPPDDFAALCTDRVAIERVYYNHRLGTKPPFEQTLPPALIERLVKQDLHKEAVLRKIYGAEISSAQLKAEAHRINATTRAPEMLAELKAALGDDPARFARSFAKPILRLNTGGRYHPAANSWTPTTTNGAPTGRRFHTAIWTGAAR